MDRKERLAEISDRISSAALRSGRTRDDVTLIAVSKTFPADAVVEVSALGQVHFGENKVQELVQKCDSLGFGTEEHPIIWHMIGHLQRNKARDVVGRARMFHALDSLRLGSALQNRLEMSSSSMDCLIQVNVSGEDSKFGVSPLDLDSLVDSLQAFDRINIRGLMTLASPTPHPESIRGEFALLRESCAVISDRLSAGAPVLSMGMSSDFEVAIEEGATHVRIGSALFGARTVTNT